MSRATVIVLLAVLAWLGVAGIIEFIYGLIVDNGWAIYGGLVALVGATYWFLQLFRKLYPTDTEGK